MARPKGSKNKKTLMEEAQLPGRIAEQRARLAKLRTEMQELSDSADLINERLKKVRRDLRTAEYRISCMEEKKKSVDAKAAVKELQAREITALVTELLKSGKSVEELRALLNVK